VNRGAAALGWSRRRYPTTLTGERVVTPSSPIAIARGATLNLSLGGGTGCDSLVLRVEGASR